MLTRAFARLALAALCACALSARGVDKVDEVKQKLVEAKKEYDGAVQKFRTGVTDWLDKREADARKVGDKKAVDRVKADRARFEQVGEIPAECPRVLQTQIGTAHLKLDKVYSAALKDLLVLREDAAAEVVVKERQKFGIEAAILLGKRTPLVTLKHTDVKVREKLFSNDGTMHGSKLKLGKDLAPYSLYTHPPSNGTAEVTYPLGGKWHALRTTVGVPTVESTMRGPTSALTFEVVGDGKVLWKSEPVTKLDAFQTCVVDVSKVKVLTLRVGIDGTTEWCRAVWFDPILVE